MPLQLPQLDDRKYDDLVAEARQLISSRDPTWTNHNPSDPGITLVELWAYLTEMLLYRVDQVTAETQLKFLKLLNGPDWLPGPALADDIRSTVVAARAHERAVTAADYERLARFEFNAWLTRMQRVEQQGGSLDEWRLTSGLQDPADLPSTVPGVGRARCVPLRNLERGTEAERTAAAPAHVSLLILADDPALPQPPASLRSAVSGFLDSRRMLATRHHVVGPYQAPVAAEVVIVAASRSGTTAITTRVADCLKQFLDPLAGGPDANGWAFGRSVFISELIQQLEAVSGVDHIVDLMLGSACGSDAVRCVPGQMLWHDNGDPIGLVLQPHQLPQAQIDTAAIVVAAAAKAVRVDVVLDLVVVGGIDLTIVRRQAREAVRTFFHPAHDGPGLNTSADSPLMVGTLTSRVELIAGVGSAAVTFAADPARCIVEGGVVTGVTVPAGSIVDWNVAVTAASA
jgi:hypothetical protein